MSTILFVENDDAFRYAASGYLTGAELEIIAVRTT
jgi:hypothetical protein